MVTLVLSQRFPGSHFLQVSSGLCCLGQLGGPQCHHIFTSVAQLKASRPVPCEDSSPSYLIPGSQCRGTCWDLPIPVGMTALAWRWWSFLDTSLLGSGQEGESLSAQQLKPLSIPMAASCCVLERAEPRCPPWKIRSQHMEIMALC